jgi:nucleoside-diphosphate-sugar epimerase
MSTLKDVTHYVIGGGPVGRATLRQLVDSGVSPTLISRSRRETIDAGAQIVGAIGDADVQDQINDGSVLYHCANAPYHRWVEELPALWDSVLEVAIRKRCRLVVATNLYAYGKPDGEITESHTKHPHTRKGVLRKEIESKIIDAVKTGQTQAILVRGSDFFGPEVNDSAIGNRFFSSLIRGKQPVFTGAVDQPHSYTYLPDFGRTMIAAAEKLTSGTHDDESS